MIDDRTFAFARLVVDPDDGRVLLICAMCDELVAHPDTLDDAVLGWDGHWDEVHS